MFFFDVYFVTNVYFAIDISATDRIVLCFSHEDTVELV